MKRCGLAWIATATALLQSMPTAAGAVARQSEFGKQTVQKVHSKPAPEAARSDAPISTWFRLPKDQADGESVAKAERFRQHFESIEGRLSPPARQVLGEFRDFFGDDVRSYLEALSGASVEVSDQGDWYNRIRERLDSWRSESKQARSKAGIFFYPRRSSHRSSVQQIGVDIPGVGSFLVGKNFDGHTFVLLERVGPRRLRDKFVHFWYRLLHRIHRKNYGLIFSSDLSEKKGTQLVVYPPLRAALERKAVATRASEARRPDRKLPPEVLVGATPITAEPLHRSSNAPGDVPGEIPEPLPADLADDISHAEATSAHGHGASSGDSGGHGHAGHSDSDGDGE